MAPNIQRLPGIMEADVASGSGLTTEVFTLHLASSQTHNVNVRPVGGAASAAVITWTALTIAGQLNPYCGTMVAQVIQTTPAVSTIRLRIRGTNAFGEYLEELTPTVSLAAKTNNFVYLAQTFSWIDTVEFQSNGLDIADDTISLGSRWDWTRTVDATNEHVAGTNLGIAVPLRLGRIIQGSASPGVQSFALRAGIWSAPGGNEPLFPREGAVPSRKAYGKLTVTAIPLNNETVTIDGKVYTWKAAITAADGDVLIGANNTEATDNLAAAINLGSGAGSLYGANTTLHPSVRALVLANGGSREMGVVAKVPGAAKNLIATTETSLTASWAATTLRFGFDGPIEVVNMTVYDITGAAAAGAHTTHSPDHYAIGQNAAGWVGSVEKLHFLKQSAVAQWAVTDNIMVRMTVISAEQRS